MPTSNTRNKTSDGGMTQLLSRTLLGAALGMAACAPPDDEPVEQAAHAVETPLFQPYVTYRLGNPNYEAWASGIAIGDLDGDGRKDLVVTTDGPYSSPNEQQAHIFRQSSGGSLAQVAQVWVGVRPRTAAIGDVTGDGRPDIVVGDEGHTTKISVLPQDASGGFGPLVSYPSPNTFAMRLGDLNDDGRLDVVSVAFGGTSQNVSVFFQQAVGGLAPPVLYSANTGGYNALEIADMNNDGRSDLVVMSGQGFAPNISILLRNADHTLAPAVTYDLPVNELGQGIGVGDLNGDGLNDLAMAYGGNRPRSYIARFLQTSAGTLGAPISETSYDIPTSLVVADVTSDGRADVIVGHRGWAKAGVYRQTTTGTLAAEELFSTTYNNVHSMGQAVGDLNGDGLPDVAFADSYSHAAVVLYRTNAPPVLALDAPTGGQHFAGMPLEVRWTASDDTGLTGFDVSASSNGGASFAPVPGCQALPAVARSCTWNAPGPASPTFVIRVTARDNAGNSATADVGFALVTPTLNVLAPNGGESWFLGTTQTITWSSNLPAGDPVSIDVSRDGGASWAALAQAPNTGSFAWLAAGAASSAARFRLSWNMNPGVSDSSDADMNLVAPSIEVTSTGGMGWPIGGARTVTWSSNLPASEAVSIELSRDGGASWTLLAGAAANTGSFGWTVTGPPTTAARFRVSSSNHPMASDAGEAFTIHTPAVTVISPNTSVTWNIGSVHVITWSHNVGAGEPFALELTRDGGSSWSPVGAVTSSGVASGSFNWTVSGPKTRNARLRVTWLGASPVADQSNVAFVIK